MIVLHLASWYPTAENAISGIFTQKHINAISEYDKKRAHLVLPLTRKHIQAKKPINLFKLAAANWFNIAIRRVTYDIINNPFYKEMKIRLEVSNEKVFGTLGQQLLKTIEKINLQEHNISLIHSHVTYPAGWIAMKISMKLGIPYIISEHMSPFPFEDFKKPIFFDQYIKNPIQRSAAVIAVSSFLRKEIALSTARIPFVIPNVIDSEVETEKRKPHNTKVQFILVGLLSEQKGIDILIKSARIMKDKGHTNFHISIVGGGQEQHSFEILASKNNVSEFFTWFGTQSHTKTLQLINQSDVFVCASRHESFGVAIVESLGCGVPVIATDCGGPSDTVNKNNGILVKKNDPLSLAAGMEWMMQNFPTYNTSLIKTECKALYSRKIIAEKYISLYDCIART